MPHGVYLLFFVVLQQNVRAPYTSQKSNITYYNCYISHKKPSLRTERATKVVPLAECKYICTNII